MADIFDAETLPTSFDNATSGIVPSVLNQTLFNETHTPSLNPQLPPSDGEHKLPGGGMQLKTKLTPTQKYAITWSRRITAPLSILGSLAIIIMILRRKNKKRRRSYNRLMLGVCVSDIIFSTLLLVSKLTIPSKLPVPGAVGNTATCTAHGFFMQWASVTAPFYNVALLFYYLRLIRYNQREDDFAKKQEPWLHGTVVLVPLAFAITGLPFTIYNPVPFAGLSCYVAAYPPNCDSNPNMACTRGELAKYFFPAYGIAPIYLAMVALYILLFLIVWTVIQKQRESRKFAQPGSLQETAVLKVTRPVMVQSIMYAVVFSFTFLFLAITRSVGYFGGPGANFFVVAIMTGIALPLQGFANFLIFIRPRYLTFRAECGESRRTSFCLSLSNQSIVEAKRCSNHYRRGSNMPTNILSSGISRDGATSRRGSNDSCPASRRGSNESCPIEDEGMGA